MKKVMQLLSIDRSLLRVYISTADDNGLQKRPDMTATDNKTQV